MLSLVHDDQAPQSRPSRSLVAVEPTFRAGSVPVQLPEKLHVSDTPAWDLPRDRADHLLPRSWLQDSRSCARNLPGVIAAAGVLATRGTRISHAAVVARQMRKVCIVNCPALVLDASGAKCRIGRQVVTERDVITVDGNNGAVYWGEVPVVKERPLELLKTVHTWRAGGSD
jgi:phosphohistidine swiveling domain-containing protein